MWSLEAPTIHHFENWDTFINEVSALLMIFQGEVFFKPGNASSRQ